VTTPIVVVGAGGHGRETALLIQQINSAAQRWELIGFLDDDLRLHGTEIGGIPVLGALESLEALPPDIQVALGVGTPQLKRCIHERLERLSSSPVLPVLMHPSVIQGDRITIGAGTQVHAGTIMTTDIQIGEACTINRRADISHDVVIGDFVTLAPSVSLAGGVHIGDETTFGIGATCIPSRRVGARCIVGAGAVVITDVYADMTVVGIPARPVRAALQQP
jgi:sugar O-acyltransferase (sialic acid O-acetyltransferase NeuD family)